MSGTSLRTAFASKVFVFLFFLTHSIKPDLFQKKEFKPFLMLSVSLEPGATGFSSEEKPLFGGVYMSVLVFPKVVSVFTPNTHQSVLLSASFTSVSQQKPIVSLDQADGPRELTQTRPRGTKAPQKWTCVCLRVSFLNPEHSVMTSCLSLTRLSGAADPPSAHPPRLQATN